jgi:hypothetical protein
MEDLPINGRNWVDLAMMAPGSRVNTDTEEPGFVSGTAGVGTFQLNLDGMQVTQNQTSGFGQPHYSKDEIAEFEFISGRFDVTQGGSTGLQVNAISKSGTNVPSGSLSGYFRDSDFIAKDFVQARVLPYSDQQLSATFGGPIIKDRIQYFVNEESERQPQTTTYSSPYPAFNIDQYGVNREDKVGAKVDAQLNPHSHLMVSAHGYGRYDPYDNRYTGGATKAPSSDIQTRRHSNDVGVVLTQTLGSLTFNELSGGYFGFYWTLDSPLPYPNAPYPGLTTGSPIYTLRGYTIGQGQQYAHEFEDVENFTVKDNLTRSFSGFGHHTWKVGGRFNRQENPVFLCIQCEGIYDMTGGAVPGNIQQLFPVWNNPSTWNVGALAPITRSYTLGVGTMNTNTPVTSAAGWVQDDWRVGTKLTMNLGLRYDVAVGTFAENASILPFLTAGRPTDKADFAPRLGFTEGVSERTVLRGGFGKYFADMGAHQAYFTQLASQTASIQVLNDGRANFVTDPFHGPNPTYGQVLGTLCSNNGNAPGCLRRSLTNPLAAPGNVTAYSWQGSIGIQHQFSDNIEADADYLNTDLRAQLSSINRNLAYNPATGANYAYTDLSHLPYPEWGTANQMFSIGESNFHALQTSVTKRMSHHWQASATFMYSRQYNLQTAPIIPGCQYVTTLNAAGQPVCNVPVTLAPDIAQQWYLSPDQRKRATANAIWVLGHGTQISGSFLYGDNGWATPTSGVDVRNTGSTGGNRLLANGTLIPYNSFKIPSIYKVDLRVQHRLKIGRAKLDLIAECYNVFNHTNLQTYTTNESSAAFGKPSGDTNISLQPRMAEFGFRTTF